MLQLALTQRGLKGSSESDSLLLLGLPWFLCARLVYDHFCSFLPAPFLIFRPWAMGEVVASGLVVSQRPSLPKEPHENKHMI